MIELKRFACVIQKEFCAKKKEKRISKKIEIKHLFSLILHEHIHIIVAHGLDVFVFIYVPWSIESGFVRALCMAQLTLL